jgi:hypothetical protein
MTAIQVKQSELAGPLREVVSQGLCARSSTPREESPLDVVHRVADPDYGLIA